MWLPGQVDTESPVTGSYVWAVAGEPGCDNQGCEWSGAEGSHPGRHVSSWGWKAPRPQGRRRCRGLAWGLPSCWCMGCPWGGAGQQGPGAGKLLRTLSLWTKNVTARMESQVPLKSPGEGVARRAAPDPHLPGWRRADTDSRGALVLFRALDRCGGSCVKLGCGVPAGCTSPGTAPSPAPGRQGQVLHPFS